MTPESTPPLAPRVPRPPSRSVCSRPVLRRCDRPSAPRQGPDRHHARPGDEPELPDLGPDPLGLREGQPRRRDQALRGRGRAAGQGAGRADPLLRRRPDDGAGGRRLAAGDRGPGASDRQPHVRPRQRQGDAARGHPVPVPPGSLADRGEDPGRGHRARTSAWPSSALKQRARHRAGRLPHAGRLQRRPGRPPRPPGHAPEAGLHLGQQQVPGAPDRPGRQAPRRLRSWTASSRPRPRPSRSSTRPGWSRSP